MVVLTLALGVGANTAVYTVVSQVLWQPLPYAHADRLAVVLQEGRGPVAPGVIVDLREQVPAFDEVAAAELWGPTWTGGAHPERLPAMRVTPNLFALLGVVPALGRAPGPNETRGIVLSHAVWQERFGGAPDIVGREVPLDNETQPVLGVMPPSFVFSPFWAQAEVCGVLDLAGKRNDRRVARCGRSRGCGPEPRWSSARPGRRDLESTAGSAPGAPPRPRPRGAITAGTRHRRRPAPALDPADGCRMRAAGDLRERREPAPGAGGAAPAGDGRPRGTRRAQFRRFSRQLFTESLVLASIGAAAGWRWRAGWWPQYPALSYLGLPRMESIGLDWRDGAWRRWA